MGGDNYYDDAWECTKKLLHKSQSMTGKRQLKEINAHSAKFCFCSFSVCSHFISQYIMQYLKMLQFEFLSRMTNDDMEQRRELGIEK